MGAGNSGLRPRNIRTAITKNLQKMKSEDMSGELSMFLDKRLGIGYVTGKGERNTQIARTIAKKSQYRVLLPKIKTKS